MEEKICNSCDLPKPIKRFRFRTKNGYRWQQGKCMDCESSEQRSRYYADIDNQRKINRERAASQPEEIKKARNKERWLSIKGTKELSEYRKEYWRTNKAQREKHKAVSRKHQAKMISELSDNYILGHITQRTSLKKEDIPKEMVEVVREIKLLNRKIRGNEKTGNS
jgi:hypothetical protein